VEKSPDERLKHRGYGTTGHREPIPPSPGIVWRASFEITLFRFGALARIPVQKGPTESSLEWLIGTAEYRWRKKCFN